MSHHHIQGIFVHIWKLNNEVKEIVELIKIIIWQHCQGFYKTRPKE